MFKIGDKVKIVRKYTMPDSNYSWSHHMDKTIGMVGKVKGYYPEENAYYVKTDIGQWTYLPESLELIEGEPMFICSHANHCPIYTDPKNNCPHAVPHKHESRCDDKCYDCEDHEYVVSCVPVTSIQPINTSNDSINRSEYDEAVKMILNGDNTLIHLVVEAMIKKSFENDKSSNVDKVKSNAITLFRDVFSVRVANEIRNKSFQVECSLTF